MKQLLQKQINADEIKQDFPILKSRNGKPLIYLDSAATSQKPVQVLKALETFYTTKNANPHRGVYSLSVEATQLYEAARNKVAQFINANSAKEIIFTRNATEAINLVANSWGRTNIKQNDTILLTEMEHHSNLVPWQQLAIEKKAILKYIPINEDGTLNLAEAHNLLNEKPKVLAITHVSNVLGTINPVKELIQLAHNNNTIVLVDAAQSVPHMKVDVQDLNADFLTFSGHKMLAPNGIGVLYGKQNLLGQMPPFLFGGEMIKEVTFQNTTFNELPYKLEAGTQAVAEAVALAAAISYLENIGMDYIRQHEIELTQYALEKLKTVPKLKIYGPLNAEQRGGVIAFNLADIHAHDLASVLDDYGICIRSGHHCCMPLHDKLGTAASARISFYIYNTKEDIDAFIGALNQARKVFKL